MNTEQPWAERVTQEIGKAVLGQSTIIERMLVALLANGHVLLEGMPGLAKTLLIKSLGTALGLKFERIQFTPDLLPSDVVGTMVFQPGDGRFIPHLGPIFANLVLADEINRAPAKVQSALLEAMQERQVTIGGESHRLPHPFFVMATQNPVEQEGTYPLPEAQRDRFLFKLMVGYPEESDEREMMRRWGKVTTQPDLQPVSNAEELLSLRAHVDAVHVAPAIQDYILHLVRATRATTAPDAVRNRLAYGASPRASLGLYQASKALAWLRGLDHVAPEIVQDIFLDVMRHRVGLTYEAEAEGIDADAVLAEILNRVEVPVASIS
ncbi:MAG: MoxR family ATPase [Verrucomicrobia bacterium]|nr:MAG: MoxR family ATPase [Verrucomicrobiota bacterium]